MNSKILKALLIEQLEEMKAQDITVLDIGNQTTITDFFVIAGGTSQRHRQAIADCVIAASKQHNIEVLGREGYDTADWILIDLGDIVLHIMQQETRTRYDIEGLWQNDTATSIHTNHADAY